MHQSRAQSVFKKCRSGLEYGIVKCRTALMIQTTAAVPHKITEMRLTDFFILTPPLGRRTTDFYPHDTESGLSQTGSRRERQTQH